MSMNPLAAFGEGEIDFGAVEVAAASDTSSASATSAKASKPLPSGGKSGKANQPSAAPSISGSSKSGKAVSGKGDETKCDDLASTFVSADFNEFGFDNYGHMFKLRAETTIVITGFTVNMDTGSSGVKIYARLGDYIGNAASSAGWTEIQAVTVDGAGEGNDTNLPNLATPYTMAAGTVHSFHFVSDNAPFRFPGTSDSYGYLNHGDGAKLPDIFLFEVTVCGAEFDCSNYGLLWSGKIHFNATESCPPLSNSTYVPKP
jgi:hypothetical protein